MKIFKTYRNAINYVLYSMMLTFIPSVIIAVGFTMWDNLAPNDDGIMMSLSTMMFVLLPILIIGGTAIVWGLPELLVYFGTQVIKKPVTYIELDSRMEDITQLIRWIFLSMSVGGLGNTVIPLLLGFNWGAFALVVISLTLPLIGQFTCTRITQVVDTFDIKKYRRRRTKHAMA